MEGFYPLALAALVFGEAAAPAAAREARADRDAGYGYSAESVRFYYEDIYRPLFREALAAGGRRVYVSSGGPIKPCEFAAVKPPGVFRLFVAGESVGLRFFERDGKAWALAPAWSRLLPGRSIEAVSASVASYDSARVLLRVREVLDYEPDLVVVLTGNNENPDPASEPSSLKRFAAGLVSRSDTVREFQRYLGRRGLAGRRRRTPGEMLESYRRNLTEMARAAAGRGVPLVLCTLPRNLADVPPGGTLPLWDELFFKAWSALEWGDAGGAERLFSAYERTHPGEPFGRFGRAQVLRRLGRFSEAAEEFREAAEESETGIRPSMNRVLREVAAREGAAVADFEKGLEAAAPEGIPDFSMFTDGVHWSRSLNPYLNAIVERSVVDQLGRWAYPSVRGLRVSEAALLVEERRGPPGRSRSQTRDQVERALLSGVWMWNPDEQRICEPSVAAFDFVYRTSPGKLAWLIRPGAADRARKVLAGNFWTMDKLERLGPIWPQVLDALGETYRRRGALREAAEAFRQSLGLDPGRPLTRLRLALVERSQGDLSAAQADFDRATERADEFPEIGYYGRELFSGH